MKKTLIIVAYCAIATLALAQTSTTTTETTTQDPVTSQSDTTTTTVTSSADGTVTTFSPGQTLVVREVGLTDPVSYPLGNTVVYVDRNGKTIETSMIHPGIQVHVYYDKSGKTRKVAKIVVDQD